MLYRNGDNLKTGLIQYLTNKQEITIFSPYIKSSSLKELLNAPNLLCKQIIVRWEAKDLALGSSDIEIYDICKANNIALYFNHRIHLKLFTDNFEDAFLGSANISKRALSDGDDRFNYEVCSYHDSISRDDRLYLQEIINSSILVTDEIYNLIKDQIPDITPEIEDIAFELPKVITSNSDFLITKLPMINSPTLLWELYSGISHPNSPEEENCLCHDLALYNISTTALNKNDFFKNLTNSFFELPFIISFLKEIDESSFTNRNGEIREGLSFGAVRIWFSKNTTTAPAPRPFELTTNVQILYTWIEFLSSKKYSVTIPGRHSQVIKKNH